MTLSSTEIPARRSVAVFALLAIFMVLASYLLILGLAAACVYFPFLLLTNTNTVGLQPLILFLGGIAVAGAMLWSLVPRRDKFAAPGALLDRSAQPTLFEELEAIAAALNEPLPREVYLIGPVNAFVSDRGGIMGFGSRRVMGIGLPLLSLLTVSEFRAILAHEFAHYYSGDTSLGPWVYKTQTALLRTFGNIGSISKIGRIMVLQVLFLVVTSILKWYFIAFLRIINFISRHQEFRADELACIVAGAEPLEQGLRKIHGGSLAWKVYWESEIAPRVTQGCVPPIGEGFSRFLSNPKIREQVEKGIELEIKQGKSNPYDTHPPLRERMEAIKLLQVAPRSDDAQLAVSLIRQPGDAELEFLTALNPDLPKDSLRPVEWDQLARKVTIPYWQSTVRKYAPLLKTTTAESLPELLASLPQVVSRIPDPKGVLLTADQRKHRAGQLFAMALGLSLLEQGWELEDQPGSFYLRKGEKTFNVSEAVEELLRSRLNQESWVALCRELGISELVLPPASISASAPLGISPEASSSA
jgi:Zn-dependent protease with chaperone function